jgi:hypothetical protein
VSPPSALLVHLDPAQAIGVGFAGVDLSGRSRVTYRFAMQAVKFPTASPYVAIGGIGLSFDRALSLLRSGKKAYLAVGDVLASGPDAGQKTTSAVELARDLPQGVWLHVRLEANFATGTASVYFDDELVGSTTQGVVLRGEPTLAVSLGLASEPGIGEVEALYDDVAVSVE